MPGSMLGIHINNHRVFRVPTEHRSALLARIDYQLLFFVSLSFFHLKPMPVIKLRIW